MTNEDSGVSFIKTTDIALFFWKKKEGKAPSLHVAKNYDLGYVVWMTSVDVKI
jgi:hypothetical protein